MVSLVPRRARILIAEDDDAMRRLVVDALRADGHEVQEVSDGGRLLVAVARCCRGEEPMPDLVVSDVRMPVMTGLAMLRAVRDARWTIPIVLMTAFPSADTKAKAESFAATVLPKPFSIKGLRELVRAKLAEHPLEP